MKKKKQPKQTNNPHYIFLPFPLFGNCLPQNYAPLCFILPVDGILNVHTHFGAVDEHMLKSE